MPMWNKSAGFIYKDQRMRPKINLRYGDWMTRWAHLKYLQPFRGKRGDHECKAQSLHLFGKKFGLIDCYHANISEVHNIRM